MRAPLRVCSDPTAEGGGPCSVRPKTIPLEESLVLISVYFHFKDEYEIPISGPFRCFPRCDGRRRHR